ncbi:MAG: hypothetical protein LQ340_005522, partial [Diploschistes diacapsis]
MVLTRAARARNHERLLPLTDDLPSCVPRRRPRRNQATQQATTAAPAQQSSTAKSRKVRKGKAAARKKNARPKASSILGTPKPSEAQQSELAAAEVAAIVPQNEKTNQAVVLDDALPIHNEAATIATAQEVSVPLQSEEKLEGMPMQTSSADDQAPSPEEAVVESILLPTQPRGVDQVATQTQRVAFMTQTERTTEVVEPQVSSRTQPENMHQTTQGHFLNSSRSDRQNPVIHEETVLESIEQTEHLREGLSAGEYGSEDTTVSMHSERTGHIYQLAAERREAGAPPPSSKAIPSSQQVSGAVLEALPSSSQQPQAPAFRALSSPLNVTPRSVHWPGDSHYAAEDGQERLAHNGSGDSTLDTETVEGGRVIHCICESRVNDGKLVHCDTCDTWQHIVCYYKKGERPNKNDTHICIDCEPNQRLDVKKAKHIQYRKWKNWTKTCAAINATHKWVKQYTELLSQGESFESAVGSPEWDPSNENQISCICDNESFDGDIICCDKCDHWQHVDCYYRGQSIPGDYGPRLYQGHICVKCNPRHINHQAAQELQQRKKSLPLATSEERESKKIPIFNPSRKILRLRTFARRQEPRRQSLFLRAQSIPRMSPPTPGLQPSSTPDPLLRVQRGREDVDHGPCSYEEGPQLPIPRRRRRAHSDYYGSIEEIDEDDEEDAEHERSFKRPPPLQGDLSVTTAPVTTTIPKPHIRNVQHPTFGQPGFRDLDSHILPPTSLHANPPRPVEPQFSSFANTEALSTPSQLHTFGAPLIAPRPQRPNVSAFAYPREPDIFLGDLDISPPASPEPGQTSTPPHRTMSPTTQAWHGNKRADPGAYRPTPAQSTIAAATSDFMQPWVRRWSQTAGALQPSSQIESQVTKKQRESIAENLYESDEVQAILGKMRESDSRPRKRPGERPSEAQVLPGSLALDEDRPRKRPRSECSGPSQLVTGIEGIQAKEPLEYHGGDSVPSIEEETAQPSKESSVQAMVSTAFRLDPTNSVQPFGSLGRQSRTFGWSPSMLTVSGLGALPANTREIGPLGSIPDSLLGNRRKKQPFKPESGPPPKVPPLPPREPQQQASALSGVQEQQPLQSRQQQLEQMVREVDSSASVGRSDSSVSLLQDRKRRQSGVEGFMAAGGRVFQSFSQPSGTGIFAPARLSLIPEEISTHDDNQDEGNAEPTKDFPASRVSAARPSRKLSEAPSRDPTPFSEQTTEPYPQRQSPGFGQTLASPSIASTEIATPPPLGSDESLFSPPSSPAVEGDENVPPSSGHALGTPRAPLHLQPAALMFANRPPPSPENSPPASPASEPDSPSSSSSSTAGRATPPQPYPQPQPISASAPRHR